MKTKFILPAVLILSFAVLSSGFVYSSFSNGERKQTECPYLLQKAEKTCPYLGGKIDKSNSECPYLSGKAKCPYSGKESETETESSTKGKSIEIKFKRTIKNIST